MVTRVNRQAVLQKFRRCGLLKAEVAYALRADPGEVVDWSKGVNNSQPSLFDGKLRELSDIVDMLLKVIEPWQVQWWFRVNHPMLDNFSPLTLLHDGHSQKIREMAEDYRITSLS